MALLGKFFEASSLYRLAVQDASLWPMKPRFDSGYGLSFFLFSIQYSIVTIASNGTYLLGLISGSTARSKIMINMKPTSFSYQGIDMQKNCGHDDIRLPYYSILTTADSET